MPSEVDSVNINILGRDYQISCPPSEEEALRKSAVYLDQQMNVVKTRGSTLAYEKIAVMTALNLCHELLQKSQLVTDSHVDNQNGINRLETKIDSVLRSARQIEI